MFKRLMFLFLAVSAVSLVVTGCGGGGGGAAPNSVEDANKTAVRAHLADAYFWYDQIVDVVPSNYTTAPDYFDALLVRQSDRFSFSLPIADATSQLQEGKETGFGIRWGVTGSRIFALYVDPNSQVANVITRGAELTAVNGSAPTSLSADYLNNALFPGQPGKSVSLTFRLPGTSMTQTRSMVSETFDSTTVGQPSTITPTGGAKVGYLLFNQHLLVSETALNQAMTYFKQQGITELVLDMRYNGGGYLFVAEEVASMIGGVAVQGQVFERLIFNAKHPEQTQDPGNTLHFTAQDSQKHSLPQLGLSRVFVLTGSSTCSASESIINGLAPYVQVVRIGRTTCGKPYGSMQYDIGNQAYFALQFEGVNANGTDNYKAGFTPTCTVDDDLKYPLGDQREERLKAALYYAANNSCPPATTVTLPKGVSDSIPAGDVQMLGEKPGLKLVK